MIGYVFLVLACLLAAGGQIFMKLGADGASTLQQFINWRLLLGFVLYGLSSLLWIGALAKLPLSKVYPFTVLTFVLVYVASAVVLGERLTGAVVVGAGPVVAGLLVIASA